MAVRGPDLIRSDLLPPYVPSCFPGGRQWNGPTTGHIYPALTSGRRERQVGRTIIGSELLVLTARPLPRAAGARSLGDPPPEKSNKRLTNLEPNGC